MGRNMMRVGALAALWLLLVAVTFVGCSSRSSSENTLRREAEVFWQDQIDGKWHRCWERFSPEALEHLRTTDPEGFRSADHYAAARTRWAARHPLVRVDILSVSVDKSGKSGQVLVGLSIRGKRHPRQVAQTWHYDQTGKRWLLGAGDPLQR